MGKLPLGEPCRHRQMIEVAIHLLGSLERYMYLAKRETQLMAGCGEVGMLFSSHKSDQAVTSVPMSMAVAAPKHNVKRNSASGHDVVL